MKMKQKINMMSEIAEKYGVGLDKPFCIFNSTVSSLSDFDNKKYKFTEKGLRDEYGGGGYGETLTCILRGEYFVEKVPEFAKPIKCKEGELFLYVTVKGNIFNDSFDPENTRDVLLYKMSNMFDVNDTIPQAQIDKIVSEMKGE